MIYSRHFRCCHATSNSETCETHFVLDGDRDGRKSAGRQFFLTVSKSNEWQIYSVASPTHTTCKKMPKLLKDSDNYFQVEGAIVVARRWGSASNNFVELCLRLLQPNRAMWRRKNHYELRNYTTQESFYSLMRIFGWLILDEISDDLESAELVFLLSLDLQSRLRFRRIIMINNSLRFLLPRKLNFTILDFSLKRNYYEKGFTTLNGVIDKVYHIN